MKNLFGQVLAFGATLLTFGGHLMAQGTGGELKAAASRVDITPQRPVYIAGYSSNRKSQGVHDPLSARCLVLEQGGKRIAFVSCDVIGMPRYDIEKIRARVKSVAPEHLYIAATHTHSGPDTLGQWGPALNKSGVDAEWKAELLDKIVRLVEETSPKVQPAVVRFAQTTRIPRASKNARVAEIVDPELAVMQLLTKAGQKTIATFVNFACHPEVLNNHQLTADFPHWLYETIEKEAGGVCLYLNGAQGGMVTADFDEDVPPKGQNWKAAEAIGTGLAKRALEILAEAKPLTEAPITTRRRVFEVPLENKNFQMLIQVGIFPKNLTQDGQIVTEVNHITIGPAEFLTLPGEVLPNIGFFLKRHMTGKPKFLLGLTCDELGYILTEEDFGLKLYEYESSVSVGPLMGPLMKQNLLHLLVDKALGGGR